METFNVHTFAYTLILIGLINSIVSEKIKDYGLKMTGYIFIAIASVVFLFMKAQTVRKLWKESATRENYFR